MKNPGNNHAFIDSQNLNRGIVYLLDQLDLFAEGVCDLA
jgi:hypothetical protein